MRKIVFSALLSMAALPVVAGDTVSAVTYNPSRLGKYTYLKVNDKANFKGGLVVDGENGNDDGQLTFNSTQTTIRSATDAVPMTIKKVNTHENASNVTVNMENTSFNVTSSAGNTGAVSMQGGTLTMDKATSNIGVLGRNASTLTLEANTLNDQKEITLNDSLVLGDIAVEQPTQCFKSYGTTILNGTKGGKLKVLTLVDPISCDGTPSTPTTPTTPTCKYVWKQGQTISYMFECYVVNQNTIVWRFKDRRGTYKENTPKDNPSIGYSLAGGVTQAYQLLGYEPMLSGNAEGTECDPVQYGAQQSGAKDYAYGWSSSDMPCRCPTDGGDGKFYTIQLTRYVCTQVCS